MSFDWSEYLFVAEQLAAMIASGPPDRTEAWQRSAVSRAYDAAFATARHRLRDTQRFTPPPGRNIHALVSAQYEQHPDPRRNRIGVLLRGLRANRNRCDYDDEVPGLSELTVRALTAARQILDELRLL